MHIQQEGLDSTWTIGLYKKHYVRVFIWKDQQSMLNAFGDSGYWGRAITGNCALDTEKCKVRIPRKYGEIHLVKGKYNSGMVAHETQHIMNYFINDIGWNLTLHDEKIAFASGLMTSDFWKGHYLVYP